MVQYLRDVHQDLGHSVVELDSFEDDCAIGDNMMSPVDID
jgi:hypothetical protein